MSDNIYDILGKLNGLAPKENPISTTEPVYESVDPRGDIMEAVTGLEEKFNKYKADSEDESNWLNPKAKRTVQLAKAKYPETASDLEAVIASLGDKTEELDQRDRETAAWMDKAKATIDNQQREIKQTEQAVNDANARYDAQEKRFQEFNQQVAAMNLPPPEQAKAAVKLAQQPQASASDVAAQVNTQQPMNVVQMPTSAGVQTKPVAIGSDDSDEKTSDTTDTDQSNVVQLFPNVAAPGAATDSEEKNSEEEKKTGTYNESMNQNKKIIKEDRQEGDPLLGIENWGLISQGYTKALDQVVLSFAGNKLLVTAPQLFGLVQVFNGMQPESKDVFVKKNLAFYNSTMQLLSSPQVVKAQEDFPEYQASNPVWRKKMAATATKYNPKQLDFFGTPNMSENINKMAKSLMERFMSFKEEAKPDFLDLDKDGDTDEPMKKAAKDAKEHEPAKVDKDAVAKRKRLQALKDRQEDERAEKDDYDSKSSTRKIKGRAYGGAAQKDDEEKDLDESGLQAYLGKKKYGKEGMKALQQAGREGASKEKMAMLRAKHDKMDEANWLPGQKGIPVPNPTDAITKKPGYVPPPKYVPNKPGEIEEVSYSAKAARAGKDIGKPGKQFAKIEKSAEKYGARDPGAVAGAVLKKLRANEGEELDEGKMKDIHYDLMRLADKKGYTSKKQFTPADYDELAKPHGISGKELAVALGHKKVSQVAEVAPPGAKAERMVKHIKKGYSKDGKLTPKEKGIAYATAWKAHNKGQVEEATKFGDTIKNSKAELKKHKMVHEGRNPESSEYTYETIGRILSDEQPGLDCNSEAFVKAVYDELIEMKLTPKAARWLVHYDEDFLSDCATSYSHFCDSKEKEAMECGAPMNAFVSEEPVIDAVQELDEIARLAGLARENYNPMVPGDSASPLTYAGCSKCNADPCCCEDEKDMDEGMGCSEDELNEAATRKDFRMVADLLKSIPDIAKRTELAMYHADIFKQQNPRFKKEMFLAAAGVDTTPIKDVEDEVLVGEAEVEVEEGNEFSGALAKARAEGKKEFEVDGKKYTVKEDINLNVSATGEEDVVNLIRKLSGMPVVAIQAQPAVAEEVVAEEGPKERDVEYTNTPREEIAGTDAAIPAGADLNRAKKQYKKEYPGDNPMAVAEAKEEQLWRAYESMINDLKA